MTASQAKTILRAYRPWASDAQDREVTEALALCRQDAELARWFEKHCATQNSIREKFRAIPVPDGLQQQILSEYKSHQLVAWWKRPALMATAAMVTLLISVGSLWFSLPRPPRQDVGFTSYRNRMVRAAVRTYGMDLETNDVAQIRAYLASHQAPGDYVLPTTLEQTQVVGCGALSWQGKPVGMVCFRTGKLLAPGAKSDLFLFVIDQKNLVNAPQTEMPMVDKVSTMVTATWAEGGKVYVLAGFDVADLKLQL